MAALFLLLLKDFITHTLHNGLSKNSLHSSFNKLLEISNFDSFVYVIALSKLTTILTWVLTICTGNHSYMDRLWPILPPIYAWIISNPTDTEALDYRALLMAALLTIWGVRLAFYFYIKGVYDCRGYDDYRWVSIKRGMPRLRFQLFNFFFIAVFQNVLLVLMVLPVYYVKANRYLEPLCYKDALIALLTMVCVLGETIADCQQWSFQQRKKTSKDADFLSSGLFRLSRHPNYFFEMAIFSSLYLFTLDGPRTALNWSVCGAVLYVFVFQKSIKVTESISRQKYARYETYQRTTNKVIPNPFALFKSHKA